MESDTAAYEYLLGLGHSNAKTEQLWELYEASKESVTENETDPEISNRHGDSWIYIPGHGRFSYQEVYNYVESGKIIETYDKENNTVSYKWNNSAG